MLTYDLDNFAHRDSHDHVADHPHFHNAWTNAHNRHPDHDGVPLCFSVSEYDVSTRRFRVQYLHRHTY